VALGVSVSLRPLAEADLGLVARWLGEPHVARWWLTATTVEEELDDIRATIAGTDPGEVLLAELDGRAIGWCQWYRWWDSPSEAEELAVDADDLGIDYAIGAPDAVGRGLGTEMIGELVRRLRAHADAAIVSEPDAANTASRRVLEKNGFELVDVRALRFEAEPLSAIYRLSARSPSNVSHARR
jgi:RimJ/RimL family protein N-acetyltransferase